MELWDVLDEYGNKTGKTIERGKPFAQGEYHLIVNVWIVNRNGEFLISKRMLTKYPFPGMWEPTCGCAIKGDDSLSAALREVKEELGIILDSKAGKIFKRFVLPISPDIVDVWLFRQEVDIRSVVFQPEETNGAQWVTKEMIYQLIENDQFIGRQRLPYIDELFYAIEEGTL